jgi:hypothetical protein
MGNLGDQNEAAGAADGCAVHQESSGGSVGQEKGAVTVLTQRMPEELVRRNYAATTVRSCLMTVEEFRRYSKKRLDHLGPDDTREVCLRLL